MRKILLTLCLLSALLLVLATGSSRTVKADDQFRIQTPPQCLYYECWTYYGTGILEERCEWTIKDCDWSNPECLMLVK